MLSLAEDFRVSPSFYVSVRKELAFKKKELKHWKWVERTTKRNRELDEAQEKIVKLERDIKRLSKQTLDAQIEEFEKFRAACPAIQIMYKRRAGKFGSHIRLVYQSGGLSATSIIPRRDAKRLYEKLIGGT